MGIAGLTGEAGSPPGVIEWVDPNSSSQVSRPPLGGEEYEQWYEKRYHIDIFPELIGYRPIRLDTLLKRLPTKRT
jgi:hypothetical protein